jgi:predicted O-linked N-acetylglucosamine transferase (SPINDLY family)
MNAQDPNAPCQCGSGKKYENCCLSKTIARPHAQKLQVLWSTSLVSAQPNRAPTIAEICSMVTRHLDNGRINDALRLLERGIALDPDNGELQYLAAEAEFASGLKDEAIFRLVTLLRKTASRNAAVHTRLGDMFSAVGRTMDAQEAYRYALGLIPKTQPIPQPLWGIFHSSVFSADFDTIRAHGDIWDFFGSLPSYLLPSFFLKIFPYAVSIEDNRKMVALYRRWAEDAEQSARAAPLEGQVARHSGGKLRLAFLASLFSGNNVAKFFLPVLKQLKSCPDVETFYFATFGRIPDDPVQAEVISQVDAFEDVSNLAPREVAARIRANGCHVAIDLDGFIPWSKTTAMCYRAAGLQLSWINWPGTSGISQMDAIVVDQFLAPPVDGMLVEAPLILGATCWVPADLPDEPMAPAPPYKKNGYITFGTQSFPYKFTPALVALWSEVLRAVPSSRFLIVRPECSNPAFRENMLTEFQRQGVARERIDFIDNRAGGKSHLHYYNDMDVMLDSIPLTGGTTTIEALWMGVPVVTYAGPGVHQRLSHTLLCNLGLADLSGNSSADYIANAVALANCPSRISELKLTLRETIRTSAFFDTPGLVERLLNAIKASLNKAGTPSI